MRLLRVEVRRYFSRRLTKVTAVAVLAIVGVMLLGDRPTRSRAGPAMPGSPAGGALG